MPLVLCTDPDCPHVFSNEAERDEHVSTYHGSAPPLNARSTAGGFLCGIGTCTKSTPTEHGIKTHRAMVHRTKSRAEVRRPKSEQRSDAASYVDTDGGEMPEMLRDADGMEGQTDGQIEEDFCIITNIERDLILELLADMDFGTGRVGEFSTRQLRIVELYGRLTST